MPTQATSNQMIGRVNEYVERRYPDADIKARLVHAQAELAGRFQAPRSGEASAKATKAGDAKDLARPQTR